MIAVRDGRIFREEACDRYQLSKEELFAWEDALKTSGPPGLHATRKYRPSPETAAGEPTGGSRRDLSANRQRRVPAAVD